jgi:hypothetical protein
MNNQSKENILNSIDSFITYAVTDEFMHCCLFTDVLSKNAKTLSLFENINIDNKRLNFNAFFSSLGTASDSGWSVTTKSFSIN